MEAKFKIDMHIHSSNSDGRKNPYEVIDLAAQLGMEKIVFTDHSGVTFSDDLYQYALKKNIDIPLMGLEVSTIHEGNKYHILCYGRNLRNPELQDYLMYPTKVKNDVFIKIINGLHENGILIPSTEEILKGVTQEGTYKHPDRWMLTRTLIASYVANQLGIDIDKAKSLFSKGKYPKEQIIFVENQMPKEEKYLPTIDVIKKMRNYGAGVILAHPWWECGRGNDVHTVKKDIETFINAGLLGLEMQSYHMSDEYMEAGKELFNEFPDLFAIGGSDYHGDHRSFIGDRGVTLEEYNKFLEVITV